MSDVLMQTLYRYARRLGRASDEEDGGMLQRYAQSGDPAAFAWLVGRHGPMVLGVCRRVLGLSADAEDAFQATFLALARQARSIRDRDRVASWLHRVAYRSARKARSRLPMLPLEE